MGPLSQKDSAYGSAEGWEQLTSSSGLWYMVHHRLWETRLVLLTPGRPGCAHLRFIYVCKSESFPISICSRAISLSAREQFGSKLPWYFFHVTAQDDFIYLHLLCFLPNTVNVYIVLSVGLYLHQKIWT